MEHSAENLGAHSARREANLVSAASKRDFFCLSREALVCVLKEHFDLPRFRADQLFQWVYRRGVRSFDEMTNLSAANRARLSQYFVFPQVATRERKISSDGSRKYLFEVGGGDLVETVMIKQPTRMTLCVSSQVGCAMGCKFCRTATMKLRRNLSTSEIIRQVLAVIEDAREFEDSFQNVVFMGMGEPLHNFEGVTEALRIMKDPFGLNLSGRKITVSSVGLVPAIERFAQAGIDVNLAISLNATDDETRESIMPVNKAFPLARLLETLRNYPLRSRKRFTIEYVMLHGVNDRDEDLKRLPRLLHGIPSKVNLIPYNVNAGLGFEPPPREQLVRWQKTLMGKGLETTIRWSKGQDIDAACGQLVTSSKRVTSRATTPAVSS